MSNRSSFQGVLASVVVLLFTASVASTDSPPRVGDYAFLLGTTRCTWEWERASRFYSRPDILDAASCQRWATQQGFEFTGSGDDAWVAASQPPTTDCDCESKTQRWLYGPCIGFAYSCTKPGTGCAWDRVGTSDVEVETAAACRSNALSSGGAYYGFNAGDAASKKPESSCICGESRTQWYPETASNWRLLCRGVKYTCLGPALKFKGPIPRKILDSLQRSAPAPRP
jgi:hypothetical protein